MARAAAKLKDVRRNEMPSGIGRLFLMRSPLFDPWSFLMRHDHFEFADHNDQAT
jgi:hypothetical protein